MMQECRKFGIGMVVSSQRISDFRRQVIETVGSHLILKVNHPDAKLLAPLLTIISPLEVVAYDDEDI